ncbi:hypothetical protein [Actinomadura madurae]|uniref:hypothetical protein n=1 Tax=Actinomadura madurae TaxID=1993 RepID=UPI0020D20F08|nr:hypothetical protein [Actinomadura madurae]MCP9967122.1 hypothetical protein [Actinomadura madurae]MCQ0008882.1 hypothetical protein [Actinomadura madurae]
MTIAALIAWLITAAGGFVMLGTWIARGGPRDGSSRLPVPVIFGHALLAAAGLLVWIAYLFADTTTLAWTAFIILLPVALLGFAMFARWLPTARTESTAPEHAFPIPVVLGHGLLAVATLALVLITALQA